MQLYMLIENKLVNSNIVVFTLIPSDKSIRLLALLRLRDVMQSFSWTNMSQRFKEK